MILRLLTFVLATLAVCLGRWPGSDVANAQEPASPKHIAVLLVMYSQESKEAQALRHGLRDAGYLEGRDVRVEWRVANGDYARVPELVADIVHRKADVIVRFSKSCSERSGKTARSMSFSANTWV